MFDFMQSTNLPFLFLTIEALIFGLVIGSFLNVCVYRIPLKLSLLGRSACPNCQNVIPMYRNIPVVTYILQRGQSACCQQRISPQYPVVEALTGMLSVIVLWHSQTLPQYFLWFTLFFCPLLVIAFIDMQLKIIPDVISLPGIGVGIGVRIYQDWPNFVLAVKTSALGLVIGGGVLLVLAEVFSRIKKTEAMGGGDIKLAAMLGAFLGWKPLIFIFFSSSVFAVVYVLTATILRQKVDRTIPFGPFLSLGAMTFWLYGKEFTDWYFAVQGFSHNPMF